MSAGWAMAVGVSGPLAAAAVAWVWPRAGRGLALATAAVVVVAVGSLLAEVLGGGVQVHRVGGWGAPLGIELRADGLAVWMLAVTALIGSVVALYARGYYREPTGSEGQAGAARFFWPLFLFLWGAQNALFLSADLFNLYVTLELVGVSAVALVALAGGAAALAAAMRYLVVSLSASLFYLLGVALVYGQCGTVDLASVALGAKAGPALGVAAALMTGGLLTKAALFPLHFWLPPAHANAPAPVSALLSALVVKGAFYLLLRLWLEAFQAVGTQALFQFLGGLGAAAIVWGSVQALFQERLKLLIAYSTVAQLGYLFLVFPLVGGGAGGGMAGSGGLVFLAAHACAKTAMFLSAGNLMRAVGHDRVARLDGALHALPLSAFALGLASLSLMGLPPSGGFAGKWLLLTAALAQGQWWWAVVLILGSLLSAAYLMRVLPRAFTRISAPAPVAQVSLGMEWAALGLAGVAMALGWAAPGVEALLEQGTPLGGWIGGGREGGL